MHDSCRINISEMVFTVFHPSSLDLPSEWSFTQTQIVTDRVPGQNKRPIVWSWILILSAQATRISLGVVTVSCRESGRSRAFNYKAASTIPGHFRDSTPKHALLFQRFLSLLLIEMPARYIYSLQWRYLDEYWFNGADIRSTPTNITSFFIH